MRRNTMALVAAVLMVGAFSAIAPAQAATESLTTPMGCGSWAVHVYQGGCRGWVCVGRFSERCDANRVARQYRCQGYETSVQWVY